MRPGDTISIYKHKFYTIAFVLEPSRLCPDFRSGRYVYMMAPRYENDGTTSFIVRFEHEDEVRGYWQPGPVIVPGSIVRHHAFQGDVKRVHAINGPVASLSDGKGNFTVEFLWRLALLKKWPMHIDYPTVAYDDTFLRQAA